MACPGRAGEEFNIVPQLLHHGLLCNAVDYMTVEWHSRFLNAPRSLWPRNEAQGDNFIRLVKKIVLDGSMSGCRLKALSGLDDEHYVNDGTPIDSVDSRSDK